MNKMIVASLAYRPIRSIISIVAVAVEVTLILLIVGLALGILNDATQRQTGVGADVLVRPPGSSIFNGFSSAPVPIAVADKLRQQPHVVAVAPVVTQVTSGANIEIIYGVDLNSFQAVGGPLQFIEGGPFQSPYDMIVDDYYAAANHLHPGAIVHIFNHDFRISGMIPHGRGGRRYIPLPTLQEIMGAPNKASIFYVKLDDPRNADLVADEFKQIPGMSEYNIMSMRGILKSLGASKMYIVRLILRETLLLAIAGIVAGMVISTLARAGIVHKFPTLRVLPITLAWAVYATLIAIGGAMLGAVYPAFKAGQKDPIDALAYE